MNVVEVTTRVVDTTGPLNLVGITLDNLAPLGEVLSTNGARSGDVKRYRNRAARDSKDKRLARTCLNTM